MVDILQVLFHGFDLRLVFFFFGRYLTIIVTVLSRLSHNRDIAVNEKVRRRFEKMSKTSSALFHSFRLAGLNRLKQD